MATKNSILSKIKDIGKKILTWGMPSRAGLKSAVEQVTNLQKQNLPDSVYKNQIKNIISKMK